jgi:hypothetical protein
MNLEADALGAHKMTLDEIYRMKKVMIDTAEDKKSDTRSKSISANNLLVHDLEVRKYEHPPEMRSHMTIDGLPKPPNTLNVRIFGSYKKVKREEK